MPPSPEEKEQEAAKREQNRKEDVAFREETRKLDHARRLDESRLATRRAAVMGAATMLGDSVGLEQLFKTATQIEAWIKAPDEE